MSNWITKIQNHEEQVPDFLWSSIANDLNDLNTTKSLECTATRMYNYEVLAPKEVWNKILNQLNSTATQNIGGGRLIKWTIGAAAAACMATVVYFSVSKFNNNNNGINETIVSNKVANESNINTVASIEKNTIVGKKEDKNNTTNNAAASNDIASATNTNNLAVNKANNIVTNKVSPSATTKYKASSKSIVDNNIAKANNKSKKSINANNLQDELNQPLVDANGNQLIAESSATVANENAAAVGPNNGTKTRIKNKGVAPVNGYNPDVDEKLDDIILKSKEWKEKIKKATKKIFDKVIATPANFMGIGELETVLENK